MAEQRSVTANIIIDAPAMTVWRATAEDFGGIDRWLASVSRSTFIPNPDGSPLGMTRICARPIGETRETIIHYDEDRRTFAYQIDGLPPLLAYGMNRWTIGEHDNGRSQVNFRLEIDPVADADPVKVDAMLDYFQRVMNGVAEELKHWIETGQPHPRKHFAIKTSI